MITCRRHYLDDVMNGLSGEFDGDVIDIGGKRQNARGTFRPPLNKVKSWAYLNTDKSTAPDYLGDAANMPIDNEVFDWFILTEVLEHVEDPYAVLGEARRVLKTGGRGIVTMPFLNQVHADPHDYQRWTWYKLKKALEAQGLDIVSHGAMGGVVAVIYDLIRAHFYRSKNFGGFVNRVCLKGLQVAGPLVLWLDRRNNASSPFITTGWFAVIRKREANQG